MLICKDLKCWRLEFRLLVDFQLGCGSSLPGIVCIKKGASKVTFQDYVKMFNCAINMENPQVIQLVSIPNVALNLSKERFVIDSNSTFDAEISLKFTESAEFYAGDWSLLQVRLFPCKLTKE